MKDLNDLYYTKVEDFFELFFEKMHKSRKEFICLYVLSSACPKTALFQIKIKDKFVLNKKSG